MVSGYGVSSTIGTRVGSCMAFLIRENAKNAKQKHAIKKASSIARLCFLKICQS
jgi:hypothetical protein